MINLNESERRAMMEHIVKNTISSIKNSTDDEFMTNIILGEGFIQLNNMDDRQLVAEAAELGFESPIGKEILAETTVESYKNKIYKSLSSDKYHISSIDDNGICISNDKYLIQLYKMISGMISLSVSEAETTFSDIGQEPGDIFDIDTFKYVEMLLKDTNINPLDDNIIRSIYKIATSEAIINIELNS